MALPLYDGANYQLRRESPELHREFQESRDGKLVAGWELRVPDRGPDGVPYQFIFVGPTQEHRGSAIRLRMMAKGGGEPDDSAAVTVESYYKSGSERVVIFSGTYGQFRRIPDQHAANAAVAAQVRSEAGEDYVIRVAVACPDGGPRPDPVADDSYFELDCVKLWWNETA
ncbi:MAG: hypothetical protein FJ315_07845 [SAR202 cluster bacterium]|nr:hypothetical protein [SAR202 cluster bacterium]